MEYPQTINHKTSWDSKLCIFADMNDPSVHWEYSDTNYTGKIVKEPLDSNHAIYVEIHTLHSDIVITYHSSVGQN